MNKWKLTVFLISWLVLGIFVTAVNGLGEHSEEHGGKHTTVTAAETHK